MGIDMCLESRLKCIREVDNGRCYQCETCEPAKDIFTFKRDMEFHAKMEEWFDEGKSDNGCFEVRLNKLELAFIAFNLREHYGREESQEWMRDILSIAERYNDSADVDIYYVANW